jgi:predicted dehydrogenase
VSSGVAVIGCGRVGTKRAVAAVERGDRVVALHDKDHDRARALAEQLPGEPAVARSSAEALARDGVELAIVATPHADLAGIAIEAVRSGCHVLVEKPGARDASELEELAGEAERAQRVVGVGYNHRFHPAILHTRALVADGAYGELLFVRACYGHGGRPGYEREWRADRAVAGGGELLDQGVHLVDLARFFMGDVELAFAELRTSFWDAPVEDNAFLALRGTDGGFAWLHASWTEWKNRFAFEIALRSARLDVCGLGGSYGPEHLVLHEMRPEMGPPMTTSWEWPQPDGSWRLELDDLDGALAGERSQGARLEDGLAVLRIVEDAYGR